MAEELEIPNPPWEKGKCALWHKPCKEARGDCNLWKLLPVTVTTPLVTKHGMAHLCVIFASFEKLQSAIIMSPPTPGVPQGVRPAGTR